MKRLLLLLFLSSCHSPQLEVNREYLTKYSLASYITGTPDPLYNCPPQGEKILINWSLPKGAARLFPHTLYVQIRFRDHSQSNFSVPITRDCGTYSYLLCNEDYFRLCGILAYKVQLLAEDQVLNTWEHPMWQERIVLPE
ncbi:MAG: hypothetical protein WDZ27_02430 [Waddliaceae bacterium]